MKLPKSAGSWTRPDTPKRIDETNIFSYMDGGGEMYLAYRFDHLDVYEYAGPGRDPILVELYWMKTSDDAFGLLSNDWGGEPVALQAADGQESGTGSRAPRALYGAGLLRMWSDALYVRILASRETPESREHVMALGRAIAAGRPLSPRPALVKALPERVDSSFRMLGDRVWFLRSYLVLNSAYFLSSQNILDLSPATELVIAPYESVGPSSRRLQRSAATARPHLLVARYADAATARRAFAHFVAAYLPEARVSMAGTTASVNGATRIEQGWVGFELRAETLVLALDAPDEAAANRLVSAAGR